MDFELSKEQKDIQNAAKEFAEGEFVDIAHDCDINSEFPRAVWKKAGSLGFLGPQIPEE